MKKNTALFISACLLFCATQTNAQGILNKVKVYFSQPVDNSFSNGANAKYLHNSIMDTIAAYINRAKYTVDIAQYDYSAYSGDTMAHIATAVNNAYKRGVKVRWLHDSSSINTGLTLLSAGIPRFGSPPVGGIYNIMHNKFVIIDEYDSLNAIVSDGSEDWSITMNDHDFNNMVFIQSRVLARAFTNEFNIMWGDTIHGAGPNKTNSKFGTTKPNSGTHIFTIAGTKVELYFSPSDGTNTQVINTINSANTDMYCSMYDFTQTQYSKPFVTKSTGGVYTGCVLDQYSAGSGSAYTAMSGTSNFVEYTGGCCSYIYHNKYITVDPSNSCSDPMVLTGSMNWTAAGYNQNDENIIIIHNDTIANMYLQAFAKDYETIASKTLTKQKGCIMGEDNFDGNVSQIEVFPNPFSNSTTLSYTNSTDERVTIEVFNIMGQKVSTLANDETINAGTHTFQLSCPTAGVYILRIKEGEHTYVKKIVSVN
ncbi:MAG TPA: phospholipase D-like domain-containing protein [Bacteroidia bacterium]|jgi:phosphatidylserine/phosphatidylglycerophosphate/cardiolipin synthase-like enzyme|nr:phospholipase D-like domain-containing protein [Bacteroidia bacterium]